MNVDDALKISEGPHSSEMGILAREVIRLREQREQLIEELPFFKPLSKETLDILDEADIKRKEEKEGMTVDQALGSVENAGCYNTLASTVLADEVKRLREVWYMKGEAMDGLMDEVEQLRESDRERASIIREKNEEIKQLRLKQSSDCAQIRFLREDNITFRKTPPGLRVVSCNVWNDRLLEKDKEIKRLREVIEEKAEKIKQLGNSFYEIRNIIKKCIW